MIARDWLHWLRVDALPLWARHGVDYANGGFFELLGHDLTPVSRPRRARLTARQIYVFSLGPEVGWTGPAQDIVRHGLEFLIRYMISAKDDVVSVVAPSGEILVPGPDLYDDAFVLFALASVVKAFGRDPVIEALGRRLAERLLATRGHGDGSYQDADAPLLANPLMHLTEAFLAWIEAVPDNDGFWRYRSAALMGLARQRLIRRDLAAIPEVFNDDWSPRADTRGLLIEPGHQLEWAWLLARWAAFVNEPAVLADALAIAETAETHGIGPDGVMIEALDGDLAPRDASARLWPQAERAKFWHAVSGHPHADICTRAAAIPRRDAALSALTSFVVNTRPGLWRETRRAGGGFADEPVRASSLYHIACAAVTVNRPPIWQKD